LHDLEENDVVFGTKGNGRNEIFLKVLERNSEQYVQLSKFQKMGLIQKIIRDWKGDFYIMNSKTNNLCLAKKKDHDLSITDPSSRKLYTSVRRMMNYVNSKSQRQSHLLQQSECIGVPTLIPRTSIAVPMVPTARILTSNITLIKKERRQKERKNNPVLHAEIANSVAQKKHLTATDYFRKNRVTLPLPERIFLNFPCTSTSMNISSPKPSAMLVTPEPSPRAMLPSPTPISTNPFSKPGLSQNNAALIVPSFPLSPFSSATSTRQNDSENSYSKQQSTTNTLTARNKMIKKHLRAADNLFGDLEESAILALTSLGSSSSVMSR